MSKKSKDVPVKPHQPAPVPAEAVNKQKQQAEELEVAGRHKNSGQKDHKGAR